MNPDRTSLEWIGARKRHQLSHAHVQMARELGMNPQKLGKLDNDKQEPWQLPLPRFIEELYEKRFGKTRPDVVVTMEQRMAAFRNNKEERREKKRLARDLEGKEGSASSTTENPAEAPQQIDTRPEVRTILSHLKKESRKFVERSTNSSERASSTRSCTATTASRAPSASSSRAPGKWW